MSSSSWMPTADDMHYENILMRNPYSVKEWCAYIGSKLKHLPGSYKLWNSYLTDRIKETRGKKPGHKKFTAANNAYERALVTMHKYPRMWTNYCEFLIAQKLITRTRHTFDRALQALPVTQHDRVWALYFLLDIGQYDEAAKQLSIAASDDTFVSIKKKNKHQLWMDLCNLLSTKSSHIVSLDADAIIRAGICRFSDEVGTLWCSLADYYIRIGMFSKARDIYEEAISVLMTVRDFSLVFEAYAQFEEQMLHAKMDVVAEKNDIDLRLARLELLMDRRPILLSSVRLRQNPHNVHEWQSRVKLYDTPYDIVECYTEGVSKINPAKAVGYPHDLWIDFTHYYSDQDDLKNADVIFEKATEVRFKYTDHLARIWCAWIECHIKHKSYTKALSLRRHNRRDLENGQKYKKQLHKNSRLWRLRLDLEENLGDLNSTRHAYDRMIALKVASVRTVLNYALLLKENKYFEDSYRVYEKGISLFDWPHHFNSHYNGSKLERSRELYEEVIADAPVEHAFIFYIDYFQLEETYGMTPSRILPSKSRLQVYLLWLRKVEEYYGVYKTRNIYEKALGDDSGLEDVGIRTLCQRYAEMERKLGEIDRARGILTHCAQFADPRVALEFWKSWQEFEIGHGNEDTFREMLRIKRTIAARNSHVCLH
eukprot:GSMAST32.ASY1.ANO1.454.1 assembled CDS